MPKTIQNKSEKWFFIYKTEQIKSAKRFYTYKTVQNKFEKLSRPKKFTIYYFF